ncbi:alpha/beta hydrolase [Corynebacterium lowii]|uniref:DUF1023 domain-containing protein n=1 Tax=Corynebacterium lowii TaxID=1544413 RepID=A0A0Q0UE31_9CORY|nr:alpha/beta hydrolase [Corynebacterium lowii]KQB86108.1 hypothetical protein Clow_01461 [Corynebacterium lowii]MDP9852581.1 hypothetical protein [Corynebacterium lowii]
MSALTPLNSADMDRTASHTSILARHTATASTQERSQNISLRGANPLGAPLLALDRLDDASSPWAIGAKQMQKVAHVLIRTSGLQKELEQATERLLSLSNHSLVLTGATQAISSLGAVLDWHCAREITRLCTPVAAPPLHRLGSMADLSLDAIHEATLLAAPQWRDLAEKYPEARFIEAGANTVAVAFGDLDSSASVTTFVAGTGSSDTSGWPTHLERGRTIAAATGGASVVWLGYSAPSTVPHAIATQPAQAGAQALQRFQRDLAARNPTQRRVVLGYSYGSVVVGQASSTGLLTDAVVLVGSPGAVLPRASQFRLHGNGPGSVHALTAPGDPIDLTATNYGGIHGVDPTSPQFGATVWPVSPGDHSSYWNDPQVHRALREIANPDSPGVRRDAEPSGSTSPPP